MISDVYKRQALSGSATPGHSDFIMSQSDPVDWLITQNNNLWQGLDGINNPCPDGYRLPTRAEWEAEKATWSVVGASGGINSHLKLPAAGARSVSGDLINKGNSGDYWSSTCLLYTSRNGYRRPWRNRPAF